MAWNLFQLDHAFKNILDQRLPFLHIFLPKITKQFKCNFRTAFLIKFRKFGKIDKTMELSFSSGTGYSPSLPSSLHPSLSTTTIQSQSYKRNFVLKNYAILVLNSLTVVNFNLLQHWSLIRLVVMHR